MEHKIHGKSVLYGFPQGSVREPWLFNDFACDLFYFLEVITLYTTNLTQVLVINKLEELSSYFFKCFSDTYIKVKRDKSYLPMSGYKKSTANTAMPKNCIESDDVQEFLLITIEYSLTRTSK